MKKIFIVVLYCFFLCSICFADVEVWQDPSLKFSELKKIFIMPINSELNAGNQLMPQKQLNANLIAWAADGIGSSMGKGKITIKGRDALIEDMKFIYGDKIPEGREFFKAALEMGYTAFITADLSQKFVTEHVPEKVRTYTEYKEIEKRDAKGNIIETLRIPEEKTEITPAHDVTYLSTNFSPRIYLTNNPEGDYVAAANGAIYREYQGGPVMKVVENLVKASTKSLFAHEEEKTTTKTKSKSRSRK